MCLKKQPSHYVGWLFESISIGSALRFAGSAGQVKAHEDQQEGFGDFGIIANGGGGVELEGLISKEDPQDNG